MKAAVLPQRGGGAAQLPMLDASLSEDLNRATQIYGAATNEMLLP